MCLCGFVRVCAVLEGTEQGVRSPGVGVKGGCEPPIMDAGKWTLVLCKSSAGS